MSTEEQQPTPAKKETALLAKIGNMQALLEVDKDGQLIAQFSKLIDKDADPMSARRFNMAEVALLKKLCDCLLEDAYRSESQVVERRNG